jgi:hypothetical protein
MNVDEEWYSKAECRNSGTDIFYADFTEAGSSGKKKTNEAKKICKRCSVSAECFTYAFNADERYGVWGSFSTRERLAIRRNIDIEIMTVEIAKSIVLQSVGISKINFKHLVFTKEKI